MIVVIAIHISRIGLGVAEQFHSKRDKWLTFDQLFVDVSKKIIKLISLIFRIFKNIGKAMISNQDLLTYK